MISRSLFLLACLAISARAQHASQACLHVPQNPHSFVASPLSCAHYTICIGGNTVSGDEFRCQGTMLFDPPTQTCGNSSCFDCSPFGIQNLPHPTNCQQYLECVLGHRTILTCPQGLKFDRMVGQCNQEHLVICGDPGATTPYYPTTPGYGVPTTEYGAPTTEYGAPTTEYGVPTTEYFTTPVITTPHPNVPACIPGQVHHAHPSDCTKFFMCVNNVLWSFQCPNQLYWNQQRNTCDFPQNAGCIVGGGGGGGGGGGIPTDPPLFPPYDQWTEPNLLPPRLN